MGAPLAGSNDVAVLWRPLSPTETAQANVLIAQASALLRRAVTGLDGLMLSGAVDPVLVTMVVTNAVLRVMQNPAGVTQQSAGPEAASWSGARAAGKVVITDDEIALLTPQTADPSVGGALVGSVSVRGPWWEEVEAWGERVAPWSPAARVPPPWRRGPL